MVDKHVVQSPADALLVELVLIFPILLCSIETLRICCFP